MTFPSVIYKNFKHNFKKYIFFYFVNSLIVTMLFMYGSLINNKQVIESVSENTIKQTIEIAFCGLVVFSLIFITYTNISFLKNRGKEFGTFLTLGVTRRELGKIIFLENIIIMIASIFTGLLGGALFSKLFYMGLNKVLESTNIIFEFNMRSVALSAVIFAFIFISNTIFNFFYIRRVEIVEVIKGGKRGEEAKINIVLGGIFLIGVIGALILLPKIALGEMFSDNSLVLYVSMGILMIGPYFIIGSIISIVKIILSKFPKAYNKNILVISNLTYKLTGYKNIIYLVSLLMVGAMYFTGLTYSLYATSKMSIETTSPYDIMFVESNKYNVIDDGEINKLLENNINDYKTLDYIIGAEFSEEEEGLMFRNDKQMIISQDEYNKVMKEDIKIKKGEAINATSYDRKIDYLYPNTNIVALTDAKIEKITEYIEEDYTIKKENLDKITEGTTVLGLKNIKTLKDKKIVNGINYFFATTLVLNNEDYQTLKSGMPSNKVETAHVLNSKNEEKAYDELIKYLKEKNNLDESYWKSSLGVLYGKYPEGEKGEIEKKMPVLTEDVIKMSLESNGMNFFTISFIGILFAVAIGVILYYKVLTEIEEERERVINLKRIGIMESEIKKMITKELAVVFIMPIIMGMGLGMYAIAVVLINSEMHKLILMESLKVCVSGIVIMFIFYMMSRNKFIDEIIE